MRNLLTFVLPVSLLLLFTAMTPSFELPDSVTGLAQISEFGVVDFESGASANTTNFGGSGDGSTGGLGDLDTTNKGTISSGAGSNGTDFSGGTGGTAGGLGDVQAGGTTGGVLPTAPAAGSGVNLGGTTAGGVFGSVGTPTPTQSFYFPVVFPTVQSPSNTTINSTAPANQQSSASNLSAAQQQLLNQNNAVQSLIQGVLVFPNTDTVAGPNDLCITQRQTELQNALIACNSDSSCENKAKAACVVAMKDRCKQDQSTAENLCSVSGGGAAGSAAIADAQTKTIYVPATTNFVQATIENINVSGNVESQTITLLPGNAVISSKPLHADDVRVVIQNVQVPSQTIVNQAAAGVKVEVNKAATIVAELTAEALGEKIETPSIGVIQKPTLIGIFWTGISNMYNQVLNVLSSIGIGGGSGAGGGTGAGGGAGGGSFGTLDDGTIDGGGGGCRIKNGICAPGTCTLETQDVAGNKSSVLGICDTTSCTCQVPDFRSTGTEGPTCPAPVSKITPLKPSVTFSKTVTIRMKSPSGAKTTTCSLPESGGDPDKCDSAHLVTYSSAGARPPENQGQDQDGDEVISKGEQYATDVQVLLSLGMYYDGGTVVSGNEGVIADVNAAGDDCTAKLKEISTPKIQCLPDNDACKSSRLIKAEYIPNTGCKKISTSFEPDTYQSNDSSSPKPVGDKGASGSVENAALITGTLTVVWEGDESFSATSACNGVAVEIPEPPAKDAGEGEGGGGETGGGGGGGGSEVPENRPTVPGISDEPGAENFPGSVPVSEDTEEEEGAEPAAGSGIGEWFGKADEFINAVGSKLDLFEFFNNQFFAVSETTSNKTQNAATSGTSKKICITLGGTDTAPTNPTGNAVVFTTSICAEGSCADGSACKAYRVPATGAVGCGCTVSQQKPPPESDSGAGGEGTPPSGGTPPPAPPIAGLSEDIVLVAGSCGVPTLNRAMVPKASSDADYIKEIANTIRGEAAAINADASLTDTQKQAAKQEAAANQSSSFSCGASTPTLCAPQSCLPQPSWSDSEGVSVTCGCGGEETGAISGGTSDTPSEPLPPPEPEPEPEPYSNPLTDLPVTNAKVCKNKIATPAPIAKAVHAALTWLGLDVPPLEGNTAICTEGECSSGQVCASDSAGNCGCRSSSSDTEPTMPPDEPDESTPFGGETLPPPDPEPEPYNNPLTDVPSGNPPLSQGCPVGSSVTATACSSGSCSGGTCAYTPESCRKEVNPLTGQIVESCFPASCGCVVSQPQTPPEPVNDTTGDACGPVSFSPLFSNPEDPEFDYGTTPEQITARIQEKLRKDPQNQLKYKTNLLQYLTCPSNDKLCAPSKCAPNIASAGSGANFTITSIGCTCGGVDSAPSGGIGDGGDGAGTEASDKPSGALLSTLGTGLGATDKFVNLTGDFFFNLIFSGF